MGTVSMTMNAMKYKKFECYFRNDINPLSIIAWADFFRRDER